MSNAGKSTSLTLPNTDNATALAADDLRAAALTGIGMIPIAGPALQAILDRVIPEQMEKRRREFEELVARSIARLNEQVDDLGNFLSSDEFFSLFVRTAEQVRRTHQKEKLEALQSGLGNAASDLDFALKELFLRYLDELTVLHLRMLKMIVADQAHPKGTRRSPREVVAEFSKPGQSGDFLVDELDTVKSLISYKVPGGINQEHMNLTQLGEQFCDFFNLPEGRNHHLPHTTSHLAPPCSRPRNVSARPARQEQPHFLR